MRFKAADGSREAVDGSRGAVDGSRGAVHVEGSRIAVGISLQKSCRWF